MAEPVGLVLGALGLAGLATVCLDCFDFIGTGNAVGKDYVLLEGQLSALRIRLFAWSKACGFFDPGGYDRRLDNPNWKQHVQKQLNCISLLFLDAARLTRKYELQERYEQTVANVGQANATFIQEGLQDFLRRVKDTKKRNGFRGGFMWALKDKKSFEELIRRARESIEALELVLSNFDLFEVRRQAIEMEIQTISDVATLEGMIATSAPADVVSDAASQRLIDVRSFVETASTTHTYYTALSGPQQGQNDMMSFRRPTTNPSHESSSPGDPLAERSGTEGTADADLEEGQQLRIMRGVLSKSTNLTGLTIKFGQSDLAWGQLIAPLREADAQDVAGMEAFFKKCPILGSEEDRRDSAFSGSNRTLVRRYLEIWTPANSALTAAFVADRLDLVRASFEGPPGTPYEGGIFHVLMHCPEFPFRIPIVRMLTKVYHPNIDSQGQICMDILSGKDWSPAFGFSSFLISLCSILADPGLEDPLVPEIATVFVQDPAQFEANAASYTKRFATMDQDLSEDRLLQIIDQPRLDKYVRPVSPTGVLPHHS